MNNNYLECIYMDGTTENFDGFCNGIREICHDMISFEAQNLAKNNGIILKIIPKSQIKQIVNHYSSKDMAKLWEDENVEKTVVEANDSKEKK